MGLVINKAKKETVADYIFGAGIIGIWHRGQANNALIKEDVPLKNQ